MAREREEAKQRKKARARRERLKWRRSTDDLELQRVAPEVKELAYEEGVAVVAVKGERLFWAAGISPTRLLLAMMCALRRRAWNVVEVVSNLCLSSASCNFVLLSG